MAAREATEPRSRGGQNSTIKTQRDTGTGVSFKSASWWNYMEGESADWARRLQTPETRHQQEVPGWYGWRRWQGTQDAPPQTRAPGCPPAPPVSDIRICR